MLAELQQLKYALVGTPYEGQVWLVGGYVRDHLLGMPASADIDLVTEMDVRPLVAFLYELGLCGPPQVYPRFQTAMVRMGDVTLEFIQARRESYHPRSRKPTVVPGTLIDDAYRRDFTLNALSQNLHSEACADWTGMGLDDLRNKVLRTPLDPAQTFADDPLRILRAVRFRWRLGLTYAPDLEAALAESGSLLASISGERIRDEWTKMLQHPTAPDAMADMMRLGLFSTFLPEFEAMVGVEQGKYHHLDIWDHTLLVLRHAGHADLILSLASLLHDVGKPPTRSVDAQGNTRFFEHERVGADMTESILRRLRFSSSDATKVALLVKNHMRLAGASKFSPSAARRLVRDLGEELERLLRLVDADAKSLKPGVRVMDVQAVRDQIEWALKKVPKSQMISPLDGETICTELGLQPGPLIGAIKKALEDRVLDGTLPPGDPEQAKQALPAILESVKAAKTMM